jgi:hypothetical protein
MSSFLLDQFKNATVGIINYINSDFIRNAWFTYIDYFDINSANMGDYNVMSVLYLVSFIALPVIFLLVILYTLLSIIKYYYTIALFEY